LVSVLNTSRFREVLLFSCPTNLSAVRLWNYEIHSHVNIISVSSNATLNMGSAIIKGCAANAEAVGGQTIVGNRLLSPLVNDKVFNLMIDPDAVDQPQKQI
jgi:hypothetical protein